VPEAAVIFLVGQRFFRFGFVFQVVGCYFYLALFFPHSLVWAVSGQPLSLFLCFWISIAVISAGHGGAQIIFE
jgi:hypothetical protein